MMLSQHLQASKLQSLVARRGFHATRARPSSFYHYPSGPRTNLPFDVTTKYFKWRYWGFMGTGFALPFGIAVWQTKKNK